MDRSDIAVVAGACGGIGRARMARRRPRGLCVATVGRDAIAPGMTDTLMTAGRLKPPTVRNSAGRQHPRGGVQIADEVAAVMDRPLSPGAARLTGQLIAVDGGFTTVRPLVKSGPPA